MTEPQPPIASTSITDDSTPLSLPPLIRSNSNEPGGTIHLVAGEEEESTVINDSSLVFDSPNHHETTTEVNQPTLPPISHEVPASAIDSTVLIAADTDLPPLPRLDEVDSNSPITAPLQPASIGLLVEEVDLIPPNHTRQRSAATSHTKPIPTSTPKHGSATERDANRPAKSLHSSSSSTSSIPLLNTGAAPPDMISSAFDPTHTVRSRLMDHAHPHCVLGSSGHLLSSAAPAASMLAVFELLIHFETFKNIDLFRQGLYFLRTSFFTLSAQPRQPNGRNNSSSSSSTSSSVGVGNGATDTGSPLDVVNRKGNESPSKKGHASSATAAQAQADTNLQTQILAWEAAVHELNTPPPKKKDDDKSSGPPPPPPTSEALLATIEGAMVLKKHKVALPYYILESPDLETNALFGFADKSVYDASIQDRSNAFHSRTFRVQYCEQEVVLNDACLFRLELNLRRKVPVYLEVELMFSEYTIADQARGRVAPQVEEFKVASRHLYCLEDIYSKSVHGFVPLTFDDQHFATINTMIHTQLIDFKFRPAPHQHPPLPPPSITRNDSLSSVTTPSTLAVPVAAPVMSSATPLTSATTIASTEPSIHSSHSSPNLSVQLPSNLPTATPVSSTTSRISGGPAVPASPSSAAFPFSRPTYPTHTFAQILFPRMLHPTPHRIQTNPTSVMQLGNDYHQLFLTALIQAYNQLAATFFLYQRHCVTGLQRNNLKTVLQIPTLEIPSNITPAAMSSSVSDAESLESTSEPGGGKKQKRLRSSSGNGSRKSSYSSSSSNGPASITQAWSDEPSSTTSTSSPSSVLSPKSRSRRSSLDQQTHDLERLATESQDQSEIAAKYFLPPLYTLSYRLRDAGYCCLWENADQGAAMILSDLQLVSQQIFTLWNHFHAILPHCFSEIVKYEKKKWEKSAVNKWNNFVFKETYHIEDRWRVGHANIADIHGRTVNQLRSSGALARFCPPGPIRDCTPSIQPTEQALLFEETFKGSLPMDDTTIVSDAFEIIDSHFEEEPDAASTAEPSTSKSSSQLPSLAVVDDPPVVTLAAEEAMHHAGPLSDTIGEVAIQDVPSANKESQAGANPATATANSVPTPRRRSSSGANGNKPDIGIDFEAVSQRLSEASLAKQRAAALAAKPYEGKHLIVLVHGYQGNSWDMRLFKNHISLIYPHAQVHASTANENQTEGDIGGMGKRLAIELDTYLNDNCRELGRLSFVCHSLGGLITRAALSEPELIPYHSKLYTYISLASPHCGYLFSENSMLNTGIWFLQRWNKSACLSQLSLSDAEDHQDCFLYQLSKKPSLQYFKHVFLLASQQDKYAPFHSARIEIHPQALLDRKKGQIYHNMVSSLLGSLVQPDVHLRRGDIWFKPFKRSIDTMIGRWAHINFLTNTNYMILMLQLYPELFA